MENEIKKALTENTAKVFELISKFECIKGLYLCGGTAQALLLHHRKSEDLDFELLGSRKERGKLNTNEIVSQIMRVFPNSVFSPLGEDHFEMMLPEKVKLSFFRPGNNVPYLNTGFTFNNIVTPSIQELLGMKLYVLTQRIAFRDYYDIYSALKAGCSLHDGIRYACDFSKHSVHTKDILSRLMSSWMFVPDQKFSLLDPVYNVSSDEILLFIKETMTKEFSQNESHDKILKAFHSHTLTERQIGAQETYEKLSNPVKGKGRGYSK